MGTQINVSTKGSHVFSAKNYGCFMENLDASKRTGNHPEYKFKTV